MMDKWVNEQVSEWVNSSGNIFIYCPVYSLQGIG